MCKADRRIVTGRAIGNHGDDVAEGIAVLLGMLWHRDVGRPGRLGDLDRAGDLGRREHRQANVHVERVGVVERRCVDVGRRDALHRRDVMHRGGERAEIFWAVLGVAHEGLREQELQRFGQGRVDLARPPHRRADGEPRDELVQHGTHGEHARPRVARRERALQLGREARAIARVRGDDGELRLEAREPVLPWRDARGVDVHLLAAIVPLLQVEAEGHDDRDGFIEGEAAALREALVYQRTQRDHHHRGGSAARHGRSCHPNQITARGASRSRRAVPISKASHAPAKVSASW